MCKKISLVRMKLNAWQKKTFKGRQMEMMGIRTRLEELLGLGLTIAVVEEKKTLFA